MWLILSTFFGAIVVIALVWKIAYSNGWQHGYDEGKWDEKCYIKKSHPLDEDLSNLV